MSAELQRDVAALRARRDELLAEVLKYVPERDRGGATIDNLWSRRDLVLRNVPMDLVHRAIAAEGDLNDAARRAVLADPCVKAALDVFGAEVVEVRVRVGEGCNVPE